MILEPAVAAARDPRSPEAIRQKRGLDLRLVPVAAAVWGAVAWTVVARSWTPVVGCAVTAAFAATTLVMVNKRWRLSGDRTPRQLMRRHIIGFIGWQMLVWAIAAGVVAGITAGRMEVINDHPWMAARGITHFRGDVTIAGLPKQLDKGRIQVPVDVPSLGTLPLFMDSDELPRPEESDAERSAGTAHSAGTERNAGTAHSTGTKRHTGNVKKPPLSTVLVPGQRFNISATVRPSRNPGMIPLTLSAQRELREVPGGQPRGMWAFAQRLRLSLLNNVAWLPDEAAMLVPGMVMGDVSMQPPNVRQQFVDTGLSHLSAVSGSNIAILASAVMIISTACGARRRTTSLVTAASLCGFVVVVGPEPSVLRATVMGLIGVTAVATARWKDVVVATCISIIVLLTVDPDLAVNYGFALSVAATAGIAVLAPRWSAGVLRWWARRTQSHFHRAPMQWEAQLVRMVMVAVAADAVTIPLIAHMTGKIPVVTIAANLLVLWAVPIITTVGMALSVVGAVAAGLGLGLGATQWVSIVLLAPAEWVALVAKKLAGSPKIVVPESWAGAALTCTVVGIAVWSVRNASRAETRWACPLMLMCLVIFGRVGIVGVEIPEKHWVPPRNVTIGSGEVAVVKDEAMAVGQFGVSGASSGRVIVDGHGAANRATPRDSPAAIVVEECGKPVERPTFTASGIPVYYPCRNGTEVMQGR